METAHPTKILFVCLGNICRSPAAQGIMETLVAPQGSNEKLTIDSAGTYGGHAGSLPDSRMRLYAQQRGYLLTHRSRQVVRNDFDTFDLLIGMDDNNLQELHSLAPSPEAAKKIRRMTDYLPKPYIDHVPDPYYLGADGFEEVLNILEDACQGLLLVLQNKQGEV